MRALVGIEHVTIEDRDAVLVAPDAFDTGLDFSDAPHMALGGDATVFATFDRRLAKRTSTTKLNPSGEFLG